MDLVQLRVLRNIFKVSVKFSRTHIDDNQSSNKKLYREMKKEAKKPTEPKFPAWLPKHKNRQYKED